MSSCVKMFLLVSFVLHASIVSSYASGAEPTCPPGWTFFGSSCYLFVDENVPWTAAAVICRELDGRIVEVADQAENDFLKFKMSTVPGAENIWIGLTDFQKEGTFLWMSNKKQPEYTNWFPTQPDNLSAPERGQDCAYVTLPDGKWDDEACVYMVGKHSVCCERRPILAHTVANEA